jgi:DNA-binding CsgD family transcriptional regulator
MRGARKPDGLREHHDWVELILDSVESEEGLTPVLVSLAKRFEADVAHAFVLRGGRVLDTYLHGFGLKEAQVYERDWKDKDPRFALATGSLGQVLSDAQVIAPDVFEASAIYNEVLRKAGMRYTLFTTAPIAADLVLAQAFMRKRRAGAFDSEEIQGFSLLLPHMRRALHLRELVATLRDELQDLRRALDVLPGGVALLDGVGRLICGNATAARLLERGDGVCLERQAVTSRIPEEARQLAAAHGRAAALAEGGSGWDSDHSGPMALSLTRQRGRPLGLVFMPLRPRSELRERGHRSARVLAVFHDPDAVLRLDPGLIARLHGLTSTEALLASALAQGLSLAQFAANRGCTEQTARTHLKRVLDKTGVRRQSELVRVLLGSAALHLAQQ